MTITGIVLDLPDKGGVELGLLLSGGDHGNLLETLLVLTRLVAPADVLVGSLVEVVLNVVECVLGDVGDTETRVLPDEAGLGEELTSEELDHGRLRMK